MNGHALTMEALKQFRVLMDTLRRVRLVQALHELHELVVARRGRSVNGDVIWMPLEPTWYDARNRTDLTAFGDAQHALHFTPHFFWL